MHNVPRKTYTSDKKETHTHTPSQLTPPRLEQAQPGARQKRAGSHAQAVACILTHRPRPNTYTGQSRDARARPGMENTAHPHTTEHRDAPGGRGKEHSGLPHPHPTTLGGHGPKGPWHRVHSGLARPHPADKQACSQGKMGSRTLAVAYRKATDTHVAGDDSDAPAGGTGVSHTRTQRRKNRWATAPQVKHAERAAGSHAVHRQRQRHHWPRGPKHPCPVSGPGGGGGQVSWHREGYLANRVPPLTGPGSAQISS